MQVETVLSDEMRRVAHDLAAESYAVLIPDLFARGSVGALCVAATMRTTVTGRGAAMDDLEAARRRLADRSEVDGTRLGAIGFCMGGSFALLLARTGLYKISAPFYGRPPDLPRSCPVVAGFGDRDVGMRGAPEKLTLTGRAVRRLPIHAEYHEASAHDAHRMVVAFFEEHLACS